MAAMLALVVAAAVVTAAPVNSARLSLDLTTALLETPLALASATQPQQRLVLRHRPGPIVGGVLVGALVLGGLGFLVDSHVSTLNNFPLLTLIGAAGGGTLGGVVGYHAGEYWGEPDQPAPPAPPMDPTMKTALIVVGIVVAVVLITAVVLVAYVQSNGGLDLREGRTPPESMPAAIGLPVFRF